MTSKDILVRAHGLLDEYEIGRGHYAADVDGNATSLRDGSAVSYCATGFIQRAALDVMGTTTCNEFAEAYNTIKFTAGVNSLSYWNDHEASDQDIIDVFARAAGITTPVR